MSLHSDVTAYLLSPWVQTGPGAHPASCTVGTGSFPGVKSGRGVTLTPHPILVPWSRRSRAIPLLPLWAVRPVQSLSACTRVHVTTLFSPWSRVLENLTGSQPVKTVPTIYGTQRFITAFTRVLHLSIFWGTSMQFMSPSHFLKIHLNVILLSTPGSSKWSLSLRFPQQNTVCTSPIYVLHAPPILFFSISSPD